MELKLWAPFADLDKEWRIALPRIFGEGFEFRPSLDVTKSEGDLTVTAELPGIEPKDVEVSLEGGMLMIKGEKSEEKEISEDDRFIHERAFGKFQRRIPMPEGVAADKMTAEFMNGVLTVHVTLPEEKTAEPEKIPVTVG